VKKRDRLDSTEALLQVIREGASPQGAPGPVSSAAESAAPLRKVRFRRPRFSLGFGGLRRGAALGVDLREDSLCMVKMSRGDSPRVLDAARMPYPDGLTPDSPDFSAFLGDCLRRMNGGLGQAEIWTLIRSSDFDLVPVLIPKVSPRRVEESAYWKLQKERKFSDEESMLDLRSQGPVSDKGVDKIEVLACLARREDVEAVARLFSRAGVQLAGVTTIPGVQLNALRRAGTDPGGIAAILHMDAGFSCITICEGRKVLFCRTIKSGANSMAEALLESMPDALRVQSLDLAASRRLLSAKLLCQESAAGGECLDPEAVFQIVEPAMGRLARQVERTLDYFFANFGQRVERIVFSGELFACAQVRNFMAGQLGLREETFDPLLHRGDLARWALAEESDRLDMALAGALAFSDGAFTLNLHENYRRRAEARRRARLNDLVAAAAALLIVVAGGLYFLGQAQVRGREAELRRMEQTLARFQPPLEAPALLKLAADVGVLRRDLKDAGERLETLAVLAELSNILPPNVKVLNLTLDFGKASAPQPQGRQTAQGAAVKNGPTRLMVVDAMILGDPGEFDTTLSRFLIELDASPLFGAPVIHSNAVQDFVPEGKVMHVVLHIGLA